MYIAFGRQPAFDSHGNDEELPFELGELQVLILEFADDLGTPEI